MKLSSVIVLFRRGMVWKAPLLALAVWIAALIVTARHGDRLLYPAVDDTVTVYLLDNGFHTDIAFPAEAVRSRGGVLAQAGQAAGDGRWLAYGWGDAGFFTGHGLSFARALDGLRALFHPGNPSVIRVFAIDSDLDGDSGVVRVTLSRAGFEAMAANIEGSFVTVNGAPVLDDVATPGDPFFTSREHFSAVRLCNNWTADQLAAAGLPTSPMTDGLAPLLRLSRRWRSGV